MKRAACEVCERYRRCNKIDKTRGMICKDYTHQESEVQPWFQQDTSKKEMTPARLAPRADVITTINRAYCSTARR